MVWLARLNYTLNCERLNYADWVGVTSDSVCHILSNWQWVRDVISGSQEWRHNNYKIPMISQVGGWLLSSTYKTIHWYILNLFECMWGEDILCVEIRNLTCKLRFLIFLFLLDQTWLRFLFNNYWEQKSYRMIIWQMTENQVALLVQSLMFYAMKSWVSNNGNRKIALLSFSS